MTKEIKIIEIDENTDLNKLLNIAEITNEDIINMTDAELIEYSFSTPKSNELQNLCFDEEHRRNTLSCVNTFPATIKKAKVSNGNWAELAILTEQEAETHDELNY